MREHRDMRRAIRQVARRGTLGYLAFNRQPPPG
jgi:hypothetical protein